MRRRLALALLLVLATAGCVGRAEPNESVGIPVAAMDALVGVRGEAWFTEAWDADAARRGAEAAGFRVVDAREDMLFAQLDAHTGLHLLGTAEGVSLVVDFRVNGSREYVYAPQEEEMQRAAEAMWRDAEPDFLAALTRFEQETGWTSEGLSWRPVRVAA